MQAGETLNFIQPFSDTDHPRDPSDTSAEEDTMVMSLFLKHFINDQAENVHSFVTLEPFGLVTVFEASYRLDMEDESYLHIAVFGTQSDEGLIDFGVTVNEHLRGGIYNGGHSYLYGEKGVYRSTLAPDLSEESPLDNDEHLTAHYMLSDFYEHREMLAEARMSDDSEDREHAEQEQRRIDDELAFDEIAEMSGFDNQPPYPGEMEQLRVLIWDAQPFPLHTNTQE